MNVGLPGTGIGGLFYLTSVVILFVIEALKSIARHSSAKKRRLIFEQACITTAMIVAAIGVNYIVSTFILKKAPIAYAPSHNPALIILHILQSHPILVPVILMISILGLTQVIYLLFMIRRRYSQGRERII